MRLLALLFIATLAGCASTHEGMEAGPYVASAESAIPLCSKVTVSNLSGSHRWPECRVR